MAKATEALWASHSDAKYRSHEKRSRGLQIVPYQVSIRLPHHHDHHISLYFIQVVLAQAVLVFHDPRRL